MTIEFASIEEWLWGGPSSIISVLIKYAAGINYTVFTVTRSVYWNRPRRNSIHVPASLVAGCLQPSLRMCYQHTASSLCSTARSTTRSGLCLLWFSFLHNYNQYLNAKLIVQDKHFKPLQHDQAWTNLATRENQQGRRTSQYQVLNTAPQHQREPTTYYQKQEERVIVL